MNAVKVRLVLLALAAIPFLIASGNAATLMSPVAVPFSSGAPYPSGTNAYVAEKAIDGNLSTFTCLLDDTLTGSNGTSVPVNGAAPVTGHMIFDLGATYAIGGAKLTSRNSGFDYNPKNVDFFYFADNDPTNNALVDDIAGDTDIVPLLQNHTYPGLTSNASQTVNWQNVAARYVGMRVNSSYEESGSTNFNYQIAEMEFQTLDVLAPSNPNLVLRLQADVGVRDAAGLAPGDAGFSGNVATWIDQSGKGNDVTQTVATKRPLYAANTVNGTQPAVRFDGGDGLINSGFTWPEEFEVFAVVMNNTWDVGNENSDYDYILSSSGLSTTSGVGLVKTGLTLFDWKDHSLLGFADGYGSGEAPRVAAEYGNLTAGNWVVTDWNLSDTAAWVSLDGLVLSPDAAVTGLNSPDNQLFVGSNQNNSQFWNGDIGEILIFNQPLTAVERKQVLDYLGEKWGVAIVPEPSAFALLLLGSLALLARGRSRRRDSEAN